MIYLTETTHDFNLHNNQIRLTSKLNLTSNNREVPYIIKAVMNKQTREIGTWNKPCSLQRNPEDGRAIIGGIVVEIENHRLNELIVKRRELQVILHHEGELVIGSGPPGLQPLGLQAHIARPVMHNLLPELPIERVHKLQDLTCLPELRVHGRGVVGGGEVVDVEVEVDAVTEVVGGGKGA